MKRATVEIILGLISLVVLGLIVAFFLPKHGDTVYNCRIAETGPALTIEECKTKLN